MLGWEPLPTPAMQLMVKVAPRRCTATSDSALAPRELATSMGPVPGSQLQCFREVGRREIVAGSGQYGGF